MSKLRAAIVGAGRAKNSELKTGYGTAHNHVRGWMAAPDCEVVAVVDIVEENAKAFAEEYNIPQTFTDYQVMLRDVKPDCVSLCVWPHLHAPMVIACAEAGVKLIHCEKPMATTWGEAKAMVAACEKVGCQLTFNHQNRFEERWNTAKRLLDEGVIGTLRRMEGHWGDMMDVGPHWLDLFNMYNNETPANWVFAQIHREGNPAAFNVQVESQAMVHIHYTNDVYGLLLMGAGHTIWAEHRLLGTDGIIEVAWPEVRVWGKGDGEWRILSGEASEFPVTDTIVELVAAYREKREPATSAAKALRATEVVFATYESSRRRGRVDLPLDIDDNPLHAMIAAGEI
jgi:UDP-N-acetylglucosamine 3-dehydrogenase